MLVTVLASLWLATAASAQPGGAEGLAEGTGTVVEGHDFDYGPTVAVPPARFAGWFQPWVVALLVGLPLVAAVTERRQDLARWVRRRDWQKKSGPDE